MMTVRFKSNSNGFNSIHFNWIEYRIYSIQFNIISIQFNIKLFEGIKFELKFSVINNKFDIQFNRNLETLKYL